MNIVIVLMDTIIKTNLSKYCDTLLSNGISTTMLSLIITETKIRERTSPECVYARLNL